MILIDNKPLDTGALESGYPPESIERKALEELSTGGGEYRYESVGELKFELDLRRETVGAAKDLHRSGMNFKVFRDSKCNTDYWTRRPDGGFDLKPGVKASDAIRDIYRKGSEYGTECATAMQIVYYKALLEIFSENAYNRMFPKIRLMNWHDMDRELRKAGQMQKTEDFIPGDRLYFANPDVDPKVPEWQGENVIDLGNGTYYGHGVGIHKGDVIIRALNENRREGAQRMAYLMGSAGRPDFRRLYELYESFTDTALTESRSA
jgi:protein-glutamine gamma-glutamyltransferase